MLEFTNKGSVDLDARKNRNPEYIDLLTRKIEELLWHAPITPFFKSHISRQLLGHYLTGFFPGADSELQSNGIVLAKEEYGIFDPAKAKDIERSEIQKAFDGFYANEQMLTPEDLDLHRKRFERFGQWVVRKEPTKGDDIEEYFDKLRKEQEKSKPKLDEWERQFIEFYKEDPFSAEAKNPFEL